MEDRFDRPMVFDPAQIPDQAVAGQSVGAWGQGVAVCGAAKGYKRPRTTPTLMSSMFGFACEEEMDDVKQVSPPPWELSVGTGELLMRTIFNIIYYLTMRYLLHIIDLPMLTVSCLLTDCRSTALRAYLPMRIFSYIANSQCVSFLPML